MLCMLGRGVINRPSSNDSHCVKSANSTPGGKASLVIGSRKKVVKLERNVLLFPQTLLQAKLKSPAEWAGPPSLCVCSTEPRCMTTVTPSIDGKK